MVPNLPPELDISSCEKFYHWLCCATRNKIYYEYLNHLEQLSVENKNKHKKDDKTKITETTNERPSGFVGGGPRLSSV